MNPEQQDVYKILKTQGASALRACEIGNNMSMTLWQNDDGYTVYEDQNHHTLSFYLDGGKGTRRHLASGRTTENGFPGAICILPEHVDSAWSIEEEFRFLHLYFDKIYFDHLIEQNFDIDSRLVELQDLTYGQDPVLDNLVRNILMPQDWTDKSSQLMLEHSNHLILLHLLKHYTNRQLELKRHQGGLSPRALSRLRDYIESHLDHSLHIEDMAKQCNLSSFHFARSFQVSMGLSPHQYLLKRRIVKARSLLSEKESNIAAVAQDCGFSSQSHFTAHFKKETGLTPAKFRKLSN